MVANLTPNPTNQEGRYTRKLKLSARRFCTLWHQITNSPNHQPSHAKVEARPFLASNRVQILVGHAPLPFHKISVLYKVLVSTGEEGGERSLYEE